MKKISFLLVNYNMNGLVDQVIQSITSRLSNTDISYEILVADNSTQNEYAFDINDSQRYSSTQFYFIENKGWVDALNFLFSKIDGEFICICHPDIEFDEDCIPKLLRFLEENEDVGIVSPDMTYPNGTHVNIRLRFPTLITEYKRLFNIISHILINKKFMRDEILWERKADVAVDTVMSVCLFSRREIIDKIEQIPKEFFLYYANDYICLQAKREGYKNYYLKDATIIHYERFSDDKLYSSEKELDYKKTPAPILDRMERDLFVFYKHLCNKPTYFLFQILSTLEYSVHALASIKTTRKLVNPILKKCFDTIKVVWKT
jgi:GT2 family glycosyltransferase